MIRIARATRARAAVAAILAVAAALALLGCATPISRAQLPFASPVIEIAPGAPYERCVELSAGDRLYFNYRADPPMSFALRRAQDTTIVAYVVRDAAREEAGLFSVPESRPYCLHWEPVDRNVSWPTLLRFEMRLTGVSDK